MILAFFLSSSVFVCSVSFKATEDIVQQFYYDSQIDFDV